MITREVHLVRCRATALEYCESGDPAGAFASLVADLGKHPETAGHIGIELGTSLLMTGKLSDVDKMRKFIEEFS